MSCQHCDELLDALAEAKTELAAAREDASGRRWERDQAVASYQRLQRDFNDLQRAHYGVVSDDR